MKRLLEGKAVVITGAGSGLGRAATLLFCEHGGKVVAADVNETNAFETARLATQAGGSAKGLPCDVTDAAQVDAAVKLAVESYGRLDIMFNNAGIAPRAPPGLKRPTLVQTSHEEMKRATTARVGQLLSNAPARGCRVVVRRTYWSCYRHADKAGSLARLRTCDRD